MPREGRIDSRSLVRICIYIYVSVYVCPLLERAAVVGFFPARGLLFSLVCRLTRRERERSEFSTRFSRGGYGVFRPREIKGEKRLVGEGEKGV